MQRHQLLVTPPQPAGKRVKREVVWGYGCLEGVVEGGGRAGVRKRCEGVRVVEQSRHNECCYQLCLQAILRVEKLHRLPHVNCNLFTHNSTQNFYILHIWVFFSLTGDPMKKMERITWSSRLRGLSCRLARLLPFCSRNWCYKAGMRRLSGYAQAHALTHWLCLRALPSPPHSVRDRPLLSEACQLDTLTHKIPSLHEICSAGPQGWKLTIHNWCKWGALPQQTQC